MKRLTVLAAGLGVTLWSLIAVAVPDNDSGWSDCAGTLLATQPTSVHVDDRNVYCFEWENQSVNNDSELFFVEQSALLVCNLDTDATNPPAGGGVVTPRLCPPAASPRDASALPTASATNCLSLGALDGTEGDAATQSASVRVKRGWYFLDVTTGIPEGDTAKCWIQGEHP